MSTTSSTFLVSTEAGQMTLCWHKLFRGWYWHIRARPDWSFLSFLERRRSVDWEGRDQAGDLHNRLWLGSHLHRKGYFHFYFTRRRLQFKHCDRIRNNNSNNASDYLIPHCFSNSMSLWLVWVWRKLLQVLRHFCQLGRCNKAVFERKGLQYAWFSSF